MTFNEIKSLHEMGFTPEQIMMLTNSASFPSGADNPGTDANPGTVTDASQETPDETVAPEANISVPGEALPSASPITESGENGLQAVVDSLREEINSLRSMVQTNNIRDRTFTPAPEIPEVAAEDILAQFIRPERKGGN